MFISLHQLIRAHDVSQVQIDLRYPMSLSPWFGNVMLGGTTERLMRTYHTDLRFIKLCEYHHQGISLGPGITEYIGVGDAQGHVLFFKCRRHQDWGVENYVFPEQIDRFAWGLTQNAWFQSPINAALGGQLALGHARVDTIHGIYSQFGDMLINRDLITPDVKTPIRVRDQIHEFLHDVDMASQENNTTDGVFPKDVVESWTVDLFQPSLSWDPVLQNILGGKPIDVRRVASLVSPSPFDLTRPQPLPSERYGPCQSLSHAYLHMVDRLEHMPLTDFKATLPCVGNQAGSLVVSEVTDRFVGIFPQRSTTTIRQRIQGLLVEIHRTYAQSHPVDCLDLRAVILEKTFQEEALITFLHQDVTKDHAVHIDLVLLSYCSPGLGRFFTTPTDASAF